MNNQTKQNKNTLYINVNELIQLKFKYILDH